MNIYKISQKVNRTWDTYSDAVVVAKTAVEATFIHPNSQSENFHGWPLTEEEIDAVDFYYPNDWAKEPSQVMVELVGEAVDSLPAGTVICASFHAG